MSSHRNGQLSEDEMGDVIDIKSLRKMPVELVQSDGDGCMLHRLHRRIKINPWLAASKIESFVDGLYLPVFRRTSFVGAWTMDIDGSLAWIPAGYIEPTIGSYDDVRALGAMITLVKRLVLPTATVVLGDARDSAAAVLDDRSSLSFSGLGCS